MDHGPNSVRRVLPLYYQNIGRLASHANEAGLVAYYKFNDSALDETSNNNDLTLVNSPTYSTDVPFSGVVAALHRFFQLF